MFFNLEKGAGAVSTKRLTDSFGWNSLEAFTQHDIQELSRVLCDKLESKMAGTCVDGTIAKLFCGTLQSYVRCTEVKYESKRNEEFYDIQVKK